MHVIWLFIAVLHAQARRLLLLLMHGWSLLSDILRSLELTYSAESAQKTLVSFLDDTVSSVSFVFFTYMPTKTLQRVSGRQEVNNGF